MIALIGYGEVGRILAEDLRARGAAVCAHDVKPARRQPRCVHTPARLA
jgi:phosphoglycerate dehydrogenase-like enzyme